MKFLPYMYARQRTPTTEETLNNQVGQVIHPVDVSRPVISHLSVGTWTE